MDFKQNESRLIYEVMQTLGQYGAVFRTNSGSIRLPNGATFKGLPKGFSDILFVRPDGKACFIETKVKPRKPTPEQTAFIEKMQRLNCLAGVCYSVSEAMKICELEENNEQNN